MSTQILKDRFELKEKLICTDFKTVYLACDRHHPQRLLCRVVAIRYRQREIRYRLEREAQILERLSQAAVVPALLAHFYVEADAQQTKAQQTGTTKAEHPDASQAYDQSLEQPYTFYLVQKHIAGHPLSSEIRPGRPLSESYVIKLIQDILASLASIHAQGVVHQCLHPRYLIRQDKDGQIFLTHFATLSRLARSEIDADGHISTAVPVRPHAYTAPEQLQSDYIQNPQPASDLYALGLIAIEALTGHSHQDFSYDAVKGLMWRDQVEVSLHLAEFIDRLVRQDWRDRFESATQAMDTLSGECDRQNVAKDSRLPTIVAAPAIATSGTQTYTPSTQLDSYKSSFLRSNRNDNSVAKAASGNPVSTTFTRFSRPRPINPRLFNFFIASITVLVVLGVGVKTYQWGRYRLSRLPQTWQSWSANVMKAPTARAPDNISTRPQLTNLLEDGSILLRPEAADAYWKMYAAARAEGVELYALSGYREPTQSADSSDYATGYAVDIGGVEESTDRQPSFGKTEAFKWLKANAQTYGFELSSPRRGLIGGSSLEPWHWRYNPKADKPKR